MREFILKLSYTTRIIRNLKQIWIQPLTMDTGWALCYEDDIYSKGIIYRSTDKKLLLELQDKMMEAYSNEQKSVYL